VQPGCFANLAQRQARFSGTLKGFSASHADLISLLVNARELRLGALHLGAGFLLWVLRHAGSLFVRSQHGEGQLFTRSLPADLSRTIPV
jgi:hypothetical protein